MIWDFGFRDLQTQFQQCGVAEEDILGLGYWLVSLSSKRK
jgi:hypothetical protein